MMPEERRHKILEIIYDNKSATVSDLCHHLNASEATIRRDLAILDDENKLERIRGGAIIRSNMPVEKEDTFGEKEITFTRDKLLIARAAFKFLRDHDSIFLDAGTTTMELAKLIGRSRIHLFVATNGPQVAQYLGMNPNVELYVVGGKVRNNTLAIVGHTAIEMIGRMRLNKGFIGVNAISMQYGLTTPDYEEAEFKRNILESCRERFVLADSSKFSKVARCEIAPIESIDKLITSSFDNDDIRLECEKEGISLIEASRDWEE